MDVSADPRIDAFIAHLREARHCAPTGRTPQVGRERPVHRRQSHRIARPGMLVAEAARGDPRRRHRHRRPHRRRDAMAYSIAAVAWRRGRSCAASASARRPYGRTGGRIARRAAAGRQVITEDAVTVMFHVGGRRSRRDGAGRNRSCSCPWSTEALHCRRPGRGGRSRCTHWCRRWLSASTTTRLTARHVPPARRCAGRRCDSILQWAVPG